MPTGEWEERGREGKIEGGEEGERQTIKRVSSLPA